MNLVNKLKYARVRISEEKNINNFTEVIESLFLFLFGRLGCPGYILKIG